MKAILKTTLSLVILLATVPGLIAPVQAQNPPYPPPTVTPFVSGLSAGPPKDQNGNWPHLIPIDLVGFQAEGIEVGRGHEFFVGAFSYTGTFLPGPISDLAGTIYKGDLRTGAGHVLVEPTGEPIAGLSYDRRTDLLYTVTFSSAILVYDATSGALVAEIPIGVDLALNDILVTNKGVYCTDSLHAVLFRLLLDKRGRLPDPPVVEELTLDGFEIVPGFNANGIVGRFDGKQLIVVNTETGILYLIDTDTGHSVPIDIDGEEELFINGDGLYLDGHTLYICQNFSNKIAVVQLSGNLRSGTFIKNLPAHYGDPELNPLDVPTTIIGFGNSIYAINTHFFEIAADPFNVQILTEVVRLRK